MSSALEFAKVYIYFIFFFFNDTATTEIYTLSLHDALPIYGRTLHGFRNGAYGFGVAAAGRGETGLDQDRKSTRLNSSHSQISYAVFCLKKKTKKHKKKKVKNKNKQNTLK